MWRAGQDTAAIAVKLDLPESVIAGALTTMRELAIALRTSHAMPLQAAA